MVVTMKFLRVAMWTASLVAGVFLIILPDASLAQLQDDYVQESSLSTMRRLTSLDLDAEETLGGQEVDNGVERRDADDVDNAEDVVDAILEMEEVRRKQLKIRKMCCYFCSFPKCGLRSFKRIDRARCLFCHRRRRGCMTGFFSRSECSSVL